MSGCFQRAFTEGGIQRNLVLPQIERVKGKESAEPAENSFLYSLLPPHTPVSMMTLNWQLWNPLQSEQSSPSSRKLSLSGIFSQHKKSNRAGSQCSLKSDSASANTKEDQGCLPL